MSCSIDQQGKVPDKCWLAPSQGMDALSNYKWDKYPLITLGDTFLAVQKNGNTSWGSRIPKTLDDKLRGRQKSLPKVNLVELGPNGAFYVQFKDGSAEWSEGLSEYLQGFLEAGNVSVLAIGASSDTFYAKNANGRCIYQGLPKGLTDALIGRKKSLPKVSNVNMGPNEEWFERFNDGSSTCGGTTRRVGKAINEIKQRGGKIHEVQFGLQHSCIVRYV
jgi:hypothetical protein